MGLSVVVSMKTAPSAEKKRLCIATSGIDLRERRFMSRQMEQMPLANPLTRSETSS
jgi:hypothetical protein